MNEIKLSSSVDSLYKLVVSKHDLVMPRTSDISKHSILLRKKLETEKDSVRKEKLLNLLDALKSGNDAMFDWMSDFKNLHLHNDFYEKKSDEEILAYLKAEEIKIERVAKLMLESIGNAELFIKENDK